MKYFLGAIIIFLKNITETLHNEKWDILKQT